MAHHVLPKVLKGFRDFLPRMEIPRRNLIRSLEDHFSSYGYVPIDTPVLEYAEILLSKGGGETDKQTYRFTDHGGRDVALRFDLTVPFARYIATHRNKITMPFKRYHIGKAWRGENTQKGRYREFIQCDFDAVGTDSAAADLEIMLMMAEGLNALGAGKSRVRFSHRAMFNALLSRLKINEKAGEVLRIVDKTEKIGHKEVGQLLCESVGPKARDVLLDFITADADNKKTLDKMSRLADIPESPAAKRIAVILDAIEQVPMHCTFILDPSITRGLDYYTGIVFETFLNDLPKLGSVCSGGRYDNLTGLFMKEALSGVGASIGLDRLMAGLEELGQIKFHASLTDVLILMLDENLLAQYQKMARDLRSLGLSVEVYPESKKLAIQFKYAESQDIALALIVGSDEAKNQTVNLKDLRKRENYNGIDFSLAKKKAVELLKIG